MRKSGVSAAVYPLSLTLAKPTERG